MAGPPALAPPPDAFCLPPELPPLALPDEEEDARDPPPELSPLELSPPEFPPPDFPPPEPPLELAAPPPQATSEAQAAPTPSAVPSRINLSRDNFSKTSSSLSPGVLLIYATYPGLDFVSISACQHAPASGCRLSAFQLVS